MTSTPQDLLRPPSESPDPRPSPRGRRRWLLPAGMWAVVLAVAVGIGPARLADAVSANGAADRFISIAMTERATLRWTAPSQGTLSITYQVGLHGPERLTGEVRLTAGVQTGDRIAAPLEQQSVTLSAGQTIRRTVAIPVTCTDRVQVAVQAAGTAGLDVRDAEISTWVVPAIDASGGPVCRAI